jgi:hypothetical protein
MMFLARLITTSAKSRVEARHRATLIGFGKLNVDVEFRPRGCMLTC